MRLERLEISGFKSFSDRAELAFDQGVTAIVGPNGCGKSNVADALTWVLGEQSAKSLRGEKMEDVIFNGSDARKAGATAEVRLRLSGLPLPQKLTTTPGDEPVPPSIGAAAGADFHTNGHTTGHYANGNGNGHHATGSANGSGTGAAAVLDAPETDEAHAAAQASFVAEMAQAFSRDVEVTRRLYRSGESEYLIDGEVCRLRDVHELLMDTGLGAKAYSIIEQGKIGMILSSRPADRRSLIEEAAGITKYKARRRAAELKLEAAQQNLTRVDDIVFEVEKQRGTLKRQAAKARRYRKLREELYRWEKVLFARRYRELAAIIESSRTRLADARERETAASARLAEVESDLGRLRIEQAEADSRAARIREDAHGRELDINRRQQQQDFNRQQAESLLGRVDQLGEEVRDLEERREPARQAIELRREAALEAARAREDAAARLADATASFGTAQQQIEGLEGDVERARGVLFGVINSATAVQHAMQHGATQRERVSATIARLEVELADVAREAEALEVEKASAAEALTRAQDSLEQLKGDRGERESDLAIARSEFEGRSRSVRTREQEIAGVEARLASLEELATSRAEFSDAARMVLVQANGKVGQLGAVADYVEVDGRYERAVEACLGDLLQHVIVERHEQAEAGLSLVRAQNAGRCGFVILQSGEATGDGTISPSAATGSDAPAAALAAARPIGSLLSISGPYAETVRRVLPEAYVAETLEQAREAARHTRAPIATVDGDVVRGLHLVSGGAKGEARGILATRREIKELQERLVAEREGLAALLDEVATLEGRIADLTGTIAGQQAEQHQLEKSLVGLEGQMTRLADEGVRQARKAEVVGRERRQAEEERLQLDARHEQAQESLERLDAEKLEAEQALAEAQRSLAAARGTVDELSAHAAEARASHAALMERAAALAAEVLRLEESARELEDRLAARSREREQVQARRESLLAGVAGETEALDEAIRLLEALREELRGADEQAAALRIAVDAQEALIRDARSSLDAVRREASELDVVRATGESDLAHLAQTCTDAVQATLDEVLAEVEELERTGQAEPDAAAIAAAERAEPDAEDGESAEAGTAEAVEASAEAPVLGSITAEEAIVRLKQRIDRLGPVNMMAIEQYDELETRHAFLTTQRKDLVDSIAQTAEAIRRIDETSKARFREAFAAIQVNFAQTFSTLFGGGRAGLTLLDENDPLESGIDIVASPPGKRLQSVQLLSGGEKALTAIALMFAIFKYKPSPFCLLDEIDAPLDDANVGRFVEMLRGMLGHTQFILITHNRRTMEIANRLYGVTMEEPGVSKLISVQLH